MQTNILIVNKHFADINPTNAGWEICKPCHSFGPAARFYWLLHYVVQGCGTFCVEDKKYAVHAGQIFVIRPFEMTYYQADKNNPWEYIWIGFTAGIDLPECIKNEHVVHASRCGSVFHSILEAENLNEGREYFLCSKIYQLLSILSQKDTGENDYVEIAKSYIESNYMNSCSIIDLAAKMNLNRSYFSTLFKQKTGKSPQRYLTDYRMKKACELMLNYGCSPSEAAVSTGYPDTLSFSKMFKKYFQLSPREYLKKNRQK